MTDEQTISAAGKTRSKPFPIVAIGASAGGLEAATELLKHMPVNTGMAFVYIQHLDPTHKSMLTDIFSKTISIPVLQVTHLMRIEPNHLFIIPPNKDLAILDGAFTLNARKPKPAIHLPVDKFFHSLAEKQQEGSIGIILSGTGSDGTMGLKAIKAAGGLTFAQDESAKFESMPRSAIAEGIVDKVLSPKGIAKELERISVQSNILHILLKEQEEEVISDADPNLTGILQMLKKSTGVDFTHYKMNTIKRRILRRMLLYKIEALKAYHQYLKEHTNEITVLYNDLLIHVTSFFRDAEAMEYVKKTLLPKLLKLKQPGEGIRIWVPACSTGEEAYSLAISLIEFLGDKASSMPLQIFATDLSETAVAKARLGLYPKNELLNISPKRLERFFTKVDGHFRIVKSVRDLCVFAPHNVFRDPPFSRLDLISCCNLMIYLDTVLQKKIFSILHYALNTNGYLILGKSETISTSGQLFTQVDKRFKIYTRKKDVAAKAVFEINRQPQPVPIMPADTFKKPLAKTSTTGANIEKVVDNILLSRYVPGAVVVSHDLDIIQFRGPTGLFLELPHGKSSFNLLKMARSGLAYALRSTILQAEKSGVATKKSGLEINCNGSLHQVAIEVTPLQSEGEEKFYLVVVEEEKASAIKEGKASFSKDRIVKQLQDELNALKEDLHTFIEEHEASVEELQSANEEIISSNEELQSINEELETSKEEVESTNEELMTINNELMVRNEQLAEAHEYSEAIIGTIREAVLVLDKHLRVKTANETFYQMFRMTELETEGCLLYDMGNREWNIPGLKHLLEKILDELKEFKGFEVTQHFPRIGDKVMMLNAKSIIQKVHGQRLILLAIEDITAHRKSQQIIAEREAWFRNMADNAPVMIWVAAEDKLRTFFNHTWLAFTGRQIDEEKNNGWQKHIHTNDLENAMKLYHQLFDERKPFTIEYRLRRHDGEYRWIIDSGKPNFSLDKVFTGYTGSCTEIHEKKIMNEELEKRVVQRTKDLYETNKELERSNRDLEEYAYVASHDLQEPLRKINTYVDRMVNKAVDLPVTIKNYVVKIEDSSKRMTRLIDDLLNFSRTSRLENKLFETDLNLLLKEVLVGFDLTLTQKGGLVTYDKLPVIQAIPLQMIQLLHNLIGNALKFSKPGVPPTLTITCRQFFAEENNALQLIPAASYHEIVFKDNGIGFSPELAEKVFVIFQRLNNRQQFPGTGIGLALCRKIVNNHGGEIFAISEVNQGAAFYIILPALQLPSV